jgi:putative transposase
MRKVLKPLDDPGLWRFSIISPLLHYHDSSVPLHIHISLLAQKTFITPEGREKQFSADTIRDWHQNYCMHGLDGLRNKSRKDSGTSSVCEKLEKALVQTRKDKPQWTIKRLLRELYSQGTWNGQNPSRSSLYRFCAAQGLRRTDTKTPEQVRTFEYPCFGDLWTADFLHGPMVRSGQKAYKTYLDTIIDDATRYVVSARFHLAEDTRNLLADLMLAIQRFGIPKRLYTDNGAAFHSNHLRMVAAKLAVSLPHTPPYKPQGRGKIERFFRTVRDGFLTGRDKSSLEKLNNDFSVWLNQYHHSVHTSLDMSPLDRKLSDTGSELKQIPPTQNINDIFRMELFKRIGSDGCVRFFNKRFEIRDAIPGEMVTIYYLPWEQDYILSGPDKLFTKPVDTVKNALRFDKPRRGNTYNNTESDNGK